MTASPANRTPLLRAAILLLAAAAAVGLGVNIHVLAPSVAGLARTARLSGLDEARGTTLATAAGGHLHGLADACKVLVPSLRHHEPLGLRVAVVVDAPNAAALWAATVVTSLGAPWTRGIPLPLSLLEPQLELVSRRDPEASLVAHVEGAEIYLLVGFDRKAREAICARVNAAFGMEAIVHGADAGPVAGVALVPTLAARIRSGEPDAAHLASLLR